MQLLTAKDVAAALEIGEEAVRHHARAGRCGRKFGKAWMFTPEDVKALRKRRKAGNPAWVKGTRGT